MVSSSKASPFCSSISVHDEVVGNLVFKHQNNKLVITATLNKRLLVLALQKEGKCPPKHMMTNCATQYIQQNIQIWVNGQEIAYQKVDQQFQKHAMVYTFEAPFANPIKNIQIDSSYLLKYNSHAIVKSLFLLHQQNRTFSLSHRRRRIQVTYSK
ncbi:hypothetical protein BKI52_17535 [marine bacterium AO1-C]|nr:hypothetical protein BKI52_17535 [marine bacterium AO1-C]